MKGIFKKLGKVTKVALGVGLIATNIVLDGVGHPHSAKPGRHLF